MMRLESGDLSTASAPTAADALEGGVKRARDLSPSASAYVQDNPRMSVDMS